MIGVGLAYGWGWYGLWLVGLAYGWGWAGLWLVGLAYGWLDWLMVLPNH
jgi:hypothetical protein